MDLSTSFTPQRPLVLVGAGKMGGALLAGWLANGLKPQAVRVIDPEPSAESSAFLAGAGIEAHAVPPMGVEARLMVIAVKPQVIASVLPNLKMMAGDKTIVISIAAGATLAQLEAGLGPAAIVRCMPNTPAQVGRGITAAIANAAVDDKGRALTGRLLDAVGETVWVDDEAMIDAVTAVSGSGPAYVFLFAECLADAAVDAGLPREIAAKLARATVVGAGELLHRSDLPPDELRRNVTSPKGTTAAALEILMAGNGLAPLVKKAVAAAQARSRELAKG
jgi:pyrroline-5-carboxylate reductase